MRFVDEAPVPAERARLVSPRREARGFEAEIKDKLGIPDNVDTAALLPLGYPAAGKRYGPTTRRPLEEVTFSETCNQRWQPT